MEDKSVQSEQSETTQSHKLSQSVYLKFEKSVSAVVKGLTYITNFTAKVFAFLANVAVVGGIVFAVYQIRQTNDIEKRRIAIEVVSQAKSAETLKEIRGLKEAVKNKKIDEKEKQVLVDSLNHIINTYDHIAIMYISGIADRCIIKNSIYEGAIEVSAISDEVSYPSEYKGNIKTFLKLMEQESCSYTNPGLTSK